MFGVIKKRPVTGVSIAALVLLGCCWLLCMLDSGLAYQDGYAAAERIQIERANLLAVIQAMGAALGVFLLWWVICAFWVLARMKSVGIPRWGMSYRAVLTLVPYAAFCWWARVILYSRPAEYHYDAYMQCVLYAFSAVCCGCVLSALAVYYLCHRPWRKCKAS